MAEEIKKEKTEAPKRANKAGHKMVKIWVDKSYDNDPQKIFVGVNGYNCLLEQQAYNTVPDFIAKEYERARDARIRADKKATKMAEIKEQ